MTIKYIFQTDNKNDKNDNSTKIMQPYYVNNNRLYNISNGSNKLSCSFCNFRQLYYK